MREILFTSLLLSSSLQASSCPELNYTQLETLLSKETRAEIIFFASWCSACKKHFVEKKQVKQIFIASYDSKDAVEAVCTHFSVPCFLDAGIAKRFGVSSLPHVVQWEKGKFLP